VTAPEYLPGLASVSDRYDALILDQWGVLHDGVAPYPGAVDCLARLRAAGRSVIVLSNSGRSGAENAQFLERMGIDRELFGEVLSAGDDARDALGKHCLLLARERDGHLVAELGLTVVTEVDEADFLLAMSMDTEHQSVRGWEPVLARAAARRLPMVCGNPDLVQVTPDGTVCEAVGMLAVRYSELGGEVRSHGKPSPRIYETCLRRLPCPRGRIVTVGDSLQHDVRGARGVGLASVFVAGGIHRNDLGIAFGKHPSSESCRALFAREGVTPDYVVPSLRW
jgi:HAD superfamily hydrolase (TIGR01459 family)